MKSIKLEFDKLKNALAYANVVLSDKGINEKLRNIIFFVSPEGVKIVGQNAFAFSRTSVDAEVEDVEDSWKFQLKASELNKLLDGYSSLSRTKVDYLKFSEDGVRIKVEVHEEPLEGADDKLEQTSSFSFENAPILKKVESEISQEFPSEVDMLPSGDIFFYLDALGGVLNNDTSNSIASKLNFAEDYVFVITSFMAAFIPNKLPESFKNLTVSYSSVAFLKKLSSVSDTLAVAKGDRYLCVQADTTEAFIQFQRVNVNYNMYVQKRNRELGICMDRLYLRDVIKRMSMSPDAKAYVIPEEEILQVENKNFQQVIPLNKLKGEDLGSIKFNFSAPILDKVLLGRDDVFSSDVFLYFVPTARGYILYLSDKTGSWFTATQVTRA